MRKDSSHTRPQWDQVLQQQFESIQKRLKEHTTGLISALPIEFKTGLRASFKHLVDCHAKPRYAIAENSKSPAVVLVSYHSFIEGKRVMGDDTDYFLHVLSEHDEGLLAHISTVLQAKWSSQIALDPGHVELHELAQRPLEIENGGNLLRYSRIPVYLSGVSGPPAGTTVLRKLKHGVLLQEESYYGAYLDFRTLTDKERPIALEVFVKELVDCQPASHKYKIPSQDKFQDYFNSFAMTVLRLNEKPLCWCTVAISDELSNRPMGTLMLFTEEVPRISFVLSLHDLFFDLFNAFYKLEVELSTQRALVLAGLWAGHELRLRSVKLFNLAQELKSHRDKIPEQILNAWVTELQQLRTGSRITADWLGLLAGYPGPDENEPLKIRQAIQELGALHGQGAKLEIDIQYEFDTIPEPLLPVTQELVRNAAKRLVAGHEGRIAVKIAKDQSTTTVSVESWPHNDDLVTRLSELMARGEDDVQDKELRLGMRLVKRIARIYGGHLSWSNYSKDRFCGIIFSFSLPNG